MVDVGTGDGRFVVRTAAASPTTLAIGIDASTDGMRDGVRRARKARLDNALFVLASAERLPHELSETADLVTVHFPWGSLLQGIVGAEPGIVRGLVGLLKSDEPSGPSELRVLASVTPKDGVTVLGGQDRLDEETAPAVAAAITDIARAARAAADLTTVEWRQATRTDILHAHSTWGKRLTTTTAAAGTAEGARQAWLMRFRFGFGFGTTTV